MSSDPGTTTRLLNRMAAGDLEAAEALAPLIYGELHKLAEAQMGGRRTHPTLQPTALVNEAWLRLAGPEPKEFAGREPFFALASRVMRSVLVDHARAREALKRGGDRARVTLAGNEEAVDGFAVDILALDEALQRLKTLDPRLHQLVELRFFGGLNHPEIARAMGTSLRSVEREWRLARAWLHGELA
jgi:RNA polymerase sigma-70 factor (ECF subfamily)